MATDGRAPGGHPWAVDLEGRNEVVRQLDLWGDGVLKDRLEEMRRAMLEDRALTDRELLLATTLIEAAELTPERVARPDELEAKLLQLVADYRELGESWPETLQLVALRTDRYLRDLGVVRRRWVDACGVLGIALEDAVERYQRRWWWPCEVPPEPVHRRGSDDRPSSVRPVVWLPYYDGEPDCLGLGEGWRRGEMLIVSAELVVEAWGWRPPRPPAPSPPSVGSHVLAEGEPERVSAAYVRSGLEGIEEFLRGDRS